MIKILFIIPRLARAGTEKHLINLASGLEPNFQVHICCLFERGEVNTNLDISNIKIICLSRKNVYDLRIIFDLFRLIKREKYDIVHTYLFGFSYLASIPARFAGRPVLISSRRELAAWKRLHHCMLENFSNLFTDKVIACSEAVKKFALKNENLTKNKIVSIYNGVDLDEFYPRAKSIQILKELSLDQADKIIVTVTKLEEVKDPIITLKAIVMIKEVYPEIRCVIVGDGLLGNAIKKQIRYLNLNSNIRLLGKRDDIAEILSIADIFILTSIREGLPNAVIEAMACGLPVIATNVGGIPEAVENEKSGMLVEPKNSQLIANKIIKLLWNENLRKEMGRRGREIIENKFNLERMVKDYKDLYMSLLYS